MEGGRKLELIFCRYGDDGGLQCYTIKKWISGENYKSFIEKRSKNYKKIMGKRR